MLWYLCRSQTYTRHGLYSYTKILKISLEKGSIGKIRYTKEMVETVKHSGKLENQINTATDHYGNLGTKCSNQLLGTPRGAGIYFPVL